MLLNEWADDRLDELNIISGFHGDGETFVAGVENYFFVF